MAHRHGVKFYASLDETRIPRCAAMRKLPILPGRMTAAFYAARFADAMASGCDGVYVFNLEGAFMNEVCSVDPCRTAGMETVRFATERGSGGYRPWRYLKDGGRFCNLPKIDPGEPLPVKPGETSAFKMFIAADSLVGHPKVTAKALTNLKGGERLALSCNGRAVEQSSVKNGCYTYVLDQGVLKAGDNDFTVVFPDVAAKGTTFNDFAIEIRYR